MTFYDLLRASVVRAIVMCVFPGFITPGTGAVRVRFLRMRIRVAGLLIDVSAIRRFVATRKQRKQTVVFLRC